MEDKMKHEEFQLPRSVTTQLLHLAQISPKKEICGLIGAKNGIANTCYPVQNIADQPETRFHMDAKQQISAISNIRDKNETLFAIYHSHPTAPAEPSTTDKELAVYPDALYLIISLNTKGVLEIKGFRMIDESFTEISLSMLSD
jgi:proteasome lid subunit RPN8/RPN11